MGDALRSWRARAREAALRASMRCWGQRRVMRGEENGVFIYVGGASVAPVPPVRHTCNRCSCATSSSYHCNRCTAAPNHFCRPAFRSGIRTTHSLPISPHTHAINPVGAYVIRSHARSITDIISIVNAKSLRNATLTSSPTKPGMTWSSCGRRLSIIWSEGNMSERQRDGAGCYATF